MKINNEINSNTSIESLIDELLNLCEAILKITKTKEIFDVKSAMTDLLERGHYSKG